MAISPDDLKKIPALLADILEKAIDEHISTTGAGDGVIFVDFEDLPPEARRFYPSSNLFQTINLDLQQRYVKAGWCVASIAVTIPEDRTSLGVSSRNLKVVYDLAV